MSETENRTFPSEQLRSFCEHVFLKLGLPDEDAVLAAEVLAASDLRGIDSHGVARLDTYVGMLQAGRINPRPELKILRESQSTASVDGDNGLGLVVGPRANEIAMDKAAAVGSGWVSVSNTNHYGIAGWYVLKALERDLIGWSMTNTTPLVAPLWGAERMLGTNPIAIAFPGLEEPPVVVDLATSAAAFGKAEIAMRRGEDVPEGWLLDADGVPSQDPTRLREGGMLLPLGSTREAGGHKGYCLSAVVDLLCTVLSGANWGPWAVPFAVTQPTPDRQVGKGIGHFFGAMRIDGFTDPDELKRQVDDWIRTFRATAAQPGSPGVVIPGDPEREAEEIRSREGIPLLGVVVDQLLAVSRDTGVPLD